MKKTILAIWATLLLIPIIAFAAPSFIYQRTVLPESNNAFDLGTSTSVGGSVKWWRNIFYRGNLTNDQMSDGCASWASGILTSLGVACGSGGGGSGGGTFSTTTSTVLNRFINYPNNNTDIVNIGSTATTTAKFYFDPNTLTYRLTGNGTTTGVINAGINVTAPYFNATSTTATSTFAGPLQTTLAIFNGGPWVDARTCGAIGNGSTDDSSAINTCISNLASTGAGTLFISATPGRTTPTKYEICAGPITMKPFVDVVVQTGVYIEVCNGYASSTVQFLTGTYYSNWKGGLLQEAGTPKKLWTMFNSESNDISGGVFWNKVENVVGYYPSKGIRLYENGANNGWIDSLTFKDIVVNYPTNAFAFEDGGSKGTLGIANIKFDNVQIQGNTSTETCFQNVKHLSIRIDNSVCYDMNATSTSLSIASGAISTTVTGGYVTSNNFVDNGTRTVITGDPLYPFYASSTSGSLYVSPSGLTMIGTTSSNWSEKLSLAEGAMTLGTANSPTNSRIQFYRAGSADTQQDYVKGALTAGGDPNSGTVGISARESVVVNIDADNNTTSTFCVRNNKATIDVLTVNEIFCVKENSVGGGNVAIGTTTPGTALSVVGDTYITGHVTAKDFVSTSTITSNVFPYASTTVISTTGGAYFNTGAGAGTFQPVMAGTSTPPLLTTGVMSTLWVQRKETVANNTFYPVIVAAENDNTSSVINGGGPCYGFYLGSDISGRILAQECAKYDDPTNSIGGARISQITDTNGNFLNYMMANRSGNVTIGATSTGTGPSPARLTVLNIKSSTQDIFHADQGDGLSTSTVFTIKSTGFTGIGSTTPGTSLGVNGDAYITGHLTVKDIVSTSTITSSILPYASTTAISATTICITGDLPCKTAWPTGGGAGTYPFVPATTYNTISSGTSTPLWLQGSPFSLFASSTSVFDYASSTQFTTFATTSLGTTGTGVGIGLTNFLSSRSLTVKGTTNTSATYALELQNSAGTAWFQQRNDGYVFFNGPGLELAGNTVIESGSSGAGITFATGGGSTGNINVTTSGGTDRNIVLSPASTGKVGIGTTTPFAYFAINPVAGQGSNQFIVGSSTATNFKIDNTGHIFAPNITAVTGGTNRPACYVAATGELVDDTTSVCQVSSERFKHDIKPLSVSGLNIVNALKTVSYKPNDDALYDYKNTQYGFTAEQVAKIDPHLAEYGIDGKPRTLDDRAILSVIVKSIQELSAKTSGAVRSAEENWQNLCLVILFIYVLYNEIDKRRKIKSTKTKSHD